MYKTLQKNILDIISSALLLLLVFPIVLILLLIIVLIIKQSPIIIQERKLTLNGKKIKMIKLRTIRGNEQKLESENNSGHILFRNDLKKYVPPFCRWLRKSGLDEITQLLNVLKGEMSLVGPRPFTISDLNVIKNSEPEIYDRRERISSKPGITGYWQIYGQRNRGLENLISLDEYYERNKSLLMDIKLVLHTIILAITAGHSDSIIDSQITSSKNSAEVKFVFKEWGID